MSSGGRDILEPLFLREKSEAAYRILGHQPFFQPEIKHRLEVANFLVSREGRDLSPGQHEVLHHVPGDLVTPELAPAFHPTPRHDHTGLVIAPGIVSLNMIQPLIDQL